MLSESVLTDRSEQFRPRNHIYMPAEGLQGEEIPSHILWENMKVKLVQVTFDSPLRFKEIFNAGSWRKNGHGIIVDNVEVDGYIGLSFESERVKDLEISVSVEFVIHLSNGDVVSETKEIRLFRPELEIEDTTGRRITIDPNTGFIRGRIGIKNVGRGVLILNISSAEGSSVKLETPPEHREFVEKFMIDIHREMSKLAEDFPVFGPLWEEMLIWDAKEWKELSARERGELEEYLNRLAHVLAADKSLLLGFVEAYSKAFSRNTELIETVKRIINVYESLVSKDILLVNPFDEAILAGEKGELALTISQTDRACGDYEDVLLPKIELASSKEVRVPIYRLFEWG